MAHQAWMRIRSLRAQRPLLADNGARRAVFSAALEQSEQLFAAAAAVTPAAKPLPLFYAVSQAGRAIAAAHNETGAWDYRGHGLSVRPDPDDIRRTVVTVQEAPNASDAISAVATALDSPRLRGTLRLDELCAALPELQNARALAGDARRAIEVQPEGDNPNFLPSLHPARGRIYVTVADEDDLRSLLGNYYEADAFALCAPITRSVNGVALVNLEWPGPPRISATPGTKAVRSLDSVAPRVGDRFYLRPRLGETDAAPDRLLVWWALMLGLSSLARYQPAEWTASLDIDDSILAVALEQTLAVAEEVLPDLVAEALGSPGGLPHARMNQAFARHMASLRADSVTPGCPDSSSEGGTEARP